MGSIKGKSKCEKCVLIKSKRLRNEFFHLKEKKSVNASLGRENEYAFLIVNHYKAFGTRVILLDRWPLFTSNPKFFSPRSVNVVDSPPFIV